MQKLNIQTENFIISACNISNLSQFSQLRQLSPFLRAAVHHSFSSLLFLSHSKLHLGSEKFNLVLYRTALYCTALHCTALYCTALHCSFINCIAIQELISRNTLKVWIKAWCLILSYFYLVVFLQNRVKLKNTLSITDFFFFLSCTQLSPLKQEWERTKLLY